MVVVIVTAAYQFSLPDLLVIIAIVFSFLSFFNIIF